VVDDALTNHPNGCQQGLVLAEVRNRLNLRRLDDQRRLLAAWYKLFQDGTLCWGTDLTNASQPFFHKAAN
jgi:hypothetical protein